jgi:hypothetical protein
MTIIPAPPGLRVVNAYEGEDEVFVGETVLAFHIDDEKEFLVRAVTIEGAVSLDAGILYPDGHVEFQGDTFDTLEEFAEYHRVCEAKRKHKRQARA